MMTMEQNRKMPLDFASAKNLSGWREDFHWPVSTQEVLKEVEEMVARYMAFVVECDDEEDRTLAILGGLYAMLFCENYLEVALFVQAEQERGLRLVSEEPEVDFLRGECSPESLPPPRALAFMTLGPSPSLAPLRHFKINFSKNSFRFPLALFVNSPTVISTGPLLQSAAKIAKVPPCFVYAETLIRKTNRKEGVLEPSGKTASMASRFAGKLAECPNLNRDYRSRLQFLIEREVGACIERSACDLSSVMELKSLPEHLWTGTNGRYISRLLSLAVREKGGYVTSFSHSCNPSTYLKRRGPFTMIELAVTSEFVMPTRRFADLMAGSEFPQQIQGFKDTRFRGLNGDPSFRAVRRGKRSQASVRPKVLYVSTLFRGFRQYMAPWPQNMVYLDWQFRLTRSLRKMPVELLCKPHPEGEFKGRPHPVAEFAPTTYAPFEEVMDDTDIFLFDYIMTTTFGKALCTDKPIVLLNLTGLELNSELGEPLSQRCRILDVGNDSANRPAIDEGILEEALTKGPAESDSSFFRDLLAGDG